MQFSVDYVELTDGMGGKAEDNPAMLAADD
jgi:hypothetical protein